MISTAHTHPDPSPTPGRKPVITREDIVAAALTLVGPQRSVSSLSLREVAREAGIAPNSFYRHFHDMDELAVALIELAGSSLRRIIGAARSRVRSNASVVRSSVEVFVAQLFSDDRLLHILLREGNVGSDAFKQAVERQLAFFEEELTIDLIRLARAERKPLYDPALTAKAVTRLVFAVAATAMDSPRERQSQLTEELILVVRMIVAGSQTMSKAPDKATR